ncbi:retroviral-like aspartic protease family protein [uncultured Desulfobacter sp.]|uniref:retroviral-like aspartic protease family protein n=1 Tax=uncultured Desulfobacter sp. TaxID=240139 RepID=UPI002AAADB0F|nr:retroviral-like aspartic protease family protein [uncultured Desulfobacter sp.]
MIKILKIHLIIIVIVIFLSSCTAFKAMELLNSGVAVPNNYYSESVVPFTLKGHPMLIKAKLNNSPKEYTFWLDTGALNMIRDEVAKELSFPKGIEVEARGSGGKSKTVELIKLDKVIVGNMEVRDSAAGVTDLTGLVPKNIAGILGSNFLKHFVVTINFQNQEITFSQNTKPIALRDNEIRIPFKSDMQNGFAPIIECVVDGKIKAKGKIDTGAVGIASLPLAMMKKTNSFKEGAGITAYGSMTAGMFGSVDESLALRVNEVQIGDMKLSNIPSVSNDAKTGEVLLGIKFLEKFLVTLNYPANEMILKPYGMPFETNIPSYGIALTKKGGKTLISGIWKNSAAANMGIQPGDEVVKINSTEVSTLSLMELLAMSLDKNTNSIEIEFINDGVRNKATLHKEMLFPVL